MAPRLAATSSSLSKNMPETVTMHVSILAWSGNDFTSGAGRTASATNKKAWRFTDRIEYLDSAETLGPALEHYDVAWIIGPGSLVLRDAVEQFDASAGKLLAAVWSHRVRN